MRWSDEVFRIFGYEPGGVEPSRRAFFRFVHPDEREEVRQSLDYALREARPYAIDFRIVRPDGAERNIHERGDIIFDPKTHKPQRLVGSVQDVTERVQAEIRLNNANQELAEKVQELERRSKEINLLSEMGGRLQTCKEAEEAYVEISATAEKLFPRWSGALCITSASRTAVETVAEWGKTGQGERVFAPDDCWALRQGHPQSFRRGEKASACRHIDLTEVTESLCVPFMAQNEALGIVSLQMRSRPGTTRTRASILGRSRTPAGGGAGQAGGLGARESKIEGESQEPVDLRSAYGTLQSPLHGRIAGTGVQPGKSQQELGCDRHDGPGPLQAV